MPSIRPSSSVPYSENGFRAARCTGYRLYRSAMKLSRRMPRKGRAAILGLLLAIAPHPTELGTSSRSSRVFNCTPGYTRLSDSRIYADPSAPETGSRVMLIGCKEKLAMLSENDRAEIRKVISLFLKKNGWTFWWQVKDRSVRRGLIRETSAFRSGLLTDVLFFDPLSGES